MKKENNEEEALVHSKKNLIKCPKCGTENIKSLKKCLMCGTELVGSKSCPRCAKINVKNAKKCENCGYKFGSQKKAFFASLGFSGILLIVLFILLLFGKKTVVSNFTDTFRIISVIVLVLIVLSTFTYGRKEVVDYAAKYNGYSQPIKKKKMIVTLLAMVGFVVAGFLIYYFYFR